MTNLCAEAMVGSRGSGQLGSWWLWVGSGATLAAVSYLAMPLVTAFSNRQDEARRCSTSRLQRVYPHGRQEDGWSGAARWYIFHWTLQRLC